MASFTRTTTFFVVAFFTWIRRYHNVEDLDFCEGDYAYNPATSFCYRYVYWIVLFQLPMSSGRVLALEVPFLSNSSALWEVCALLLPVFPTCKVTRRSQTQVLNVSLADGVELKMYSALVFMFNGGSQADDTSICRK